MAWLRGGDNAATHPKVMALDSDPSAEDWTLNEAFGFLVRCAMQSAGHMTDYRIDYGTAKLMGNGRHDIVMAQLEKAGLVTVRGRGRQRVWSIIEDPEFLHIRLRDEIEWERQRKRDASNTELTVPARLRDGDACRYCGTVVSWSDRKSRRAGTYEHTDPGQPATYETYVVACKGCNSARREGRASFDAEHPLLPPPVTPHYSPSTVRWLTSHGASVRNLTDNPSAQQVPARTGTQASARVGIGTGSGRDGPGGVGSSSHPPPHDEPTQQPGQITPTRDQDEEQP